MPTIIHLAAATLGLQLWSADDIREDLPEAALDIDDDHIGILLHDSNGDGQLIVDTRQRLIDRMEQAIALIRREQAIVNAGPPPPAGQPAPQPAPLVYDDEPVTDAQAETLRDAFDPQMAGGDADWRGGVTYIYVIEHAVTVGGVFMPGGTYMRHVAGSSNRAWRVFSGDVPAAIRDIETRYLAESGQ